VHTAPWQLEQSSDPIQVVPAFPLRVRDTYPTTLSPVVSSSSMRARLPCLHTRVQAAMSIQALPPLATTPRFVIDFGRNMQVGRATLDRNAPRRLT
jgi:hypothetical protein